MGEKREKTKKLGDKGEASYTNINILAFSYGLFLLYHLISSDMQESAVFLAESGLKFKTPGQTWQFTQCFLVSPF